MLVDARRGPRPASRRGERAARPALRVALRARALRRRHGRHVGGPRHALALQRRSPRRPGRGLAAGARGGARRSCPRPAARKVVPRARACTGGRWSWTRSPTPSRATSPWSPPARLQPTGDGVLEQRTVLERAGRYRLELRLAGGATFRFAAAGRRCRRPRRARRPRRERLEARVGAPLDRAVRRRAARHRRRRTCCAYGGRAGDLRQVRAPARRVGARGYEATLRFPDAGRFRRRAAVRGGGAAARARHRPDRARPPVDASSRPGSGAMFSLKHGGNPQVLGRAGEPAGRGDEVTAPPAGTGRRAGAVTLFHRHSGDVCARSGTPARRRRRARSPSAALLAGAEAAAAHAARRPPTEDVDAGAAPALPDVTMPGRRRAAGEPRGNKAGDQTTGPTKLRSTPSRRSPSSGTTRPATRRTRRTAPRRHSRRRTCASRATSSATTRRATRRTGAPRSESGTGVAVAGAGVAGHADEHQPCRSTALGDNTRGDQTNTNLVTARSTDGARRFVVGHRRWPTQNPLNTSSQETVLGDNKAGDQRNVNVAAAESSSSAKDDDPETRARRVELAGRRQRRRRWRRNTNAQFAQTGDNTAGDQDEPQRRRGGLQQHRRGRISARRSSGAGDQTATQTATTRSHLHGGRHRRPESPQNLNLQQTTDGRNTGRRRSRTRTPASAESSSAADSVQRAGQVGTGEQHGHPGRDHALALRPPPSTGAAGGPGELERPGQRDGRQPRRRPGQREHGASATRRAARRRPRTPRQNGDQQIDQTATTSSRLAIARSTRSRRRTRTTPRRRRRPATTARATRRPRTRADGSSVERGRHDRSAPTRSAAASRASSRTATTTSRSTTASERHSGRLRAARQHGPAEQPGTATTAPGDQTQANDADARLLQPRGHRPGGLAAPGRRRRRPVPRAERARRSPTPRRAHPSTTTDALNQRQQSTAEGDNRARRPDHLRDVRRDVDQQRRHAPGGRAGAGGRRPATRS